MAGKTTVDTWKKKKSFQLIAPKAFDELSLGTTVAEKPDSLIGRTVFASLGNLTREIKKSHIMLVFGISRVEGLNAFTDLKGFEVGPGYLRRLVRRRISKIETNQAIQLKDGVKARIKVIAVTIKKAHKGQETAIRKLIEEEITLAAKQKTFNELINEALSGNLPMKIFSKAKKIMPLKRLEVIKASLLREKVIGKA